MKLEGEVAGLDLVESLVDLGREQFTGAIRFENDGVIKILYFKGGDILSASTNDRADSVDEILLRAGKVTREHVKQALAKRKENETLGDALLNLGFITRKELTWARRVQVIGVIRSIIGWGAGSYTVVADYLPKREEGTLFPLPQIVVELIVTDQDRAKFEKALDGGEALFVKASDFDEVFRRLGLNEEAEEISAQIDGTRSASEIASASGKDEFNVYKLLHALTTLGLLARREKVQAVREFSVPVDDYGSASMPDAAEAWGTSAPSFQFEEEPSAPEMGIDQEPLPAVLPEPPTATAETSPAAMPAWEALPKPPPSPPPAKAAPAAPAREEWGFDEAQIETSRRATSPGTVPRPTRPPLTHAAIRPAKKRSPWPLIAVAVVVVVGGAFAAWSWLRSRHAAPPPAAVSRAIAKKAPVPATRTASATSAEPTAPAAALPTGSSAAAMTPPKQAPSTPSSPVATRAPRVERPVSSAAAVTNTTVPATKPDALRERYDAMAREYAQTASGSFTVQFELVCQTPSIQKAIEVGGNKVWFVPISYRGQSCYRIFWGHYDTRETAAAAMREIPASLRGAAPVVVSIPKP